ncbi:MAG: type II secretion system inner membrane protein GspF [Myxococcales bacterium]|nr:type II secretion system inner membrane protein GspF [Myxococcales bacterium]MCB9669498.1 type II secretion system inner membrane protein GspF [Alphaproteobacteria bacterium]
MAVFEYKGLDGGGQAVAGIIDADSAKAARTRLRKQGVFPTEVNEQVEGATRGSGLSIEIDVAKYFQFISARDISVLTTQLSTLVGAHVPLAPALAALVEQAEKEKLKVILTKIKEKVNEGIPLADAMKDHPGVFGELYVEMVRAGEKSGALAEVLKRLSKYGESQVKLQGQIIGAMAYPILMTVVGTLMLMALFLFVLPRVRGLFEQLGGEDQLPLITRVVFFLGDSLTTWWVVALFVTAFFSLIFGFRRWVKTENGRARWDRFKLRMPVFGKMNRLIAVSRFCRTLSTLLVSGVPLLGALAIVEKVVGNTVLAAAISNAAHNIREGQSIAAPLKQSGEFPPLVTHMIAIGEKTGELESMLTNVADAYEEQVEATMSAVTSLLAPVMIMLMGGVLFFIALGLLLPMANLSQMIR